MAQKVADPCRNCGAGLAPGTSFCTLCGTAVTNRSAAQAPTTVPLVGQPLTGQVPGGQAPDMQGPGIPSPAAPVHALPGIVPVGLSAPAPLVAPQQVGGDARLAAAAVLVPGGAGRRLAAKVIDGVVPAVLLAVAMLIALVLTGAGGAQGGLVIIALAMAGASLLSLAYGVWLWIWEARAGKTPGNAMLGLRTTNMDGGPAGLLAVFLRYLVIGLASIVPGAGPLLVIVSNAWDANGKWQGWHDKVAKTLVFNIKAGRDPWETGGVAGRADYVPAPVPTLLPVRSPLAGPPPAPAPVPRRDEAPITSVPGFTSTTVVPPGHASPPRDPATQPAATPPSAAAPPIAYSEPVSFAPPPAAAASPEHVVTDPLPGMRVTAPLPPAGHGQQPAGQPGPPAPNQATCHRDPRACTDADAEAGETRIRPAAGKKLFRLTFDDGTRQDVDTVALIGRNPAGYDGEMISRLITVRDTSMSVSKTHLHVRAGHEGLWVTDRGSTNGSAIAAAGGAKAPLAAGTPVLAEIGTRVHFGERSFTVGGA